MSICVNVEAYEILDELTDKELLGEIKRRCLKVNAASEEAWTADAMADDLRTAFYARNATRFEALVRILELHEPRRRETTGLHA